MATDSRTWFYSTPEPRPFYIEERVNHTLWNHRLQAMLSCIRLRRSHGGQLERDADYVQWKPGDCSSCAQAKTARS
jgi:hypothetical protein